jgi:hypothetical protein
MHTIFERLTQWEVWAVIVLLGAALAAVLAGLRWRHSVTTGHRFGPAKAAEAAYKKAFEKEQAKQASVEIKEEPEEEEEEEPEKEEPAPLLAIGGDLALADQAAAVLARIWASGPQYFDVGSRSPGVASADQVTCSVFAPPRVRTNSRTLIQVFLHAPKHLVQAVLRAAKNDPSANRRAGSLLRAPVRRGETVQLYLDCTGVAVGASVQEVVWQGNAVGTAFEVEVLPGTAASIEGTVHVAVANVPIGEIAFTLHVEQSVGSSFVDMRRLSIADSLNMPAATATRYEQAFISYSRKDFEIVSFFAQGLSEKGIRPCVDVVELEPGDGWKDELEKHIDKADVFYLMWSDNAAKSVYVLDEIKQAADKHGGSQSHPKRPRIKPIPLQQPWPEPPDFLKDFHFFSVWQAHRAAQSIGLVRRSD